MGTLAQRWVSAAMIMAATDFAGDNSGAQGLFGALLRTIQQRQLNASEILSDLLRAPRPIIALAPRVRGGP